MIVKIEVTVRTNRVGSDVTHELELELDDDLTPEQIVEEKDEATKEWMFEQIDFYWKDIN